MDVTYESVKYRGHERAGMNKLGREGQSEAEQGGLK